MIKKLLKSTLRFFTLQGRGICVKDVRVFLGENDTIFIKVPKGNLATLQTTDFNVYSVMVSPD